MTPRAARQPKVRPPAPDTLEASWRLFLAIPLSAEVQALVAEQIEALGRERWPVRWVQPEGAHMTLQFLGETSPERAELVRLALPGVVAAHAPFDLRTAGFGVFPNFRRPRVLWLGLYGPVHRLESLQQAVSATLGELGFPSDEVYHPHITLGRVRNTSAEGEIPLRNLPADVKRRFIDAVSGAAIAPPSRPVPVHEVVLMRSHLGKGGARYELVASFSLGGSAR